MVSSSLTSFSWTSCRSAHGSSGLLDLRTLRSSHHIPSSFDVHRWAWSMMDGGLSFIDCGICQGRDHLQSLAFFLVLLTAGFDACQWVRAWSASTVSWVWLTLVVICFHKDISHIVQILWRCFRAMKWMWKQLKAPRPTNDHRVDVLTRPYRLDVGFHPDNPPFHAFLFIEFGTCFCYQTFLRKFPWTSWEWWHLSGYPRLQISCVAWESHEIPNHNNDNIWTHTLHIIIILQYYY